MKRVLPLLAKFTLVALVAICASCESTDQPKKKKPVPPSDDLSGLPWNRPRAFESGGGMGRMMPQSR